MTPLEINIILHIHSMAKPYSPDSKSSDYAISDFLRRGLIYTDEDSGCGYRMTEMGEFMVEMLCSTPYPQFKDPREQSKEEIVIQ